MLFDKYETHEPVERQPRCKRCGSTEVRWRQQTGKWVLFSLKPGVEHASECTARPNADAFGEVTE